MITKQITIFIENRAGRLSEIMSLIAERDINIRALSLADTSNYGLLRIIVDEPESVAEYLHTKNLAVATNDVLTVSVEDKPGVTCRILDALANNGISVEYMYAAVAGDNCATLIICADRPADADAILKKLG